MPCAHVNRRLASEFTRLSEAYECLSDPIARVEYDKQIQEIAAQVASM